MSGYLRVSGKNNRLHTMSPVLHNSLPHWYACYTMVPLCPAQNEVKAAPDATYCKPARRNEASIDAIIQVMFEDVCHGWIAWLLTLADACLP